MRKKSKRGGRRPGAGRPPSTGTRPARSIRLSDLELDAARIAAAAAGYSDLTAAVRDLPRVLFLAMQLRPNLGREV